jgi:uncharacterized membrane protein YcfT
MVGEPRRREHWIDVLRGSAVILVVFYHAAISVGIAGEEPPAFALVMNDIFAPFRMPLLVFLSGMLLGVALRKRAGTYLWGKFSNIGWPYLLWLIPEVFLAPAPGHWLAFLAGGTYLWFLLFIGFYYVVGLLTKRVPPILVSGVAFLLSVLAEDESKYGERLFFLLAIFMLGHWFASHERVRRFTFGSPVVLVLSAVAIAVYFVVTPTAGYGPVSIFATLGGVIILARLAQAVGGSRWVGPLREAGKDSIIVYITHVFGMQLLGVLIGTSSGLPAWLLYLMFLVTGLLTATVFVYAKRRFRPVAYLFSLTPRTPNPSLATAKP